MQALPIDPLLPEVVECLSSQSNLVLEAPPGAGKTTRLPPALLAAGLGNVVVLEPRRLAARLAARRVAFEMGERLGDTVGYQVRFEEVAGPTTRLRFVTEGVLTRRLLSDPLLKNVGVVVLDEFHERHLEGDLALALLRRLQQTHRPDLRLVVMSATLQAVPVARFLGGCPSLRSEGRQFPLQVRHTPESSLALDERVAAAMEALLREGLDGDVLVFLPGAAEIRRAALALRPLAERAGLLVLPLHGDLPVHEQDRVLEPADRPKVILSTNVAESSVTIEGITAVIDSGLARVASHSPWSGLPVLTVSRVGKSSANQRAGRAGRTAPGRVIRLYPLEDFVRRPEQDSPEIDRAELSQTLLELLALGLPGFDSVAWLDAPPPAHVEGAGQLLKRLGAISDSGAITAVGRQLARLPLHPRLSRLVIEADQRGAGVDGCALAALLSADERLSPLPSHVTESDLLVLLDSEWSQRTKRLFDQIRRLVRPRRQPARDDQALRIAVLAAFPDRVARRRQGRELLMSAGGSAVLSETSSVSEAELLVAVDVSDRKEQRLPLVRLASAISAEWLLDLFPDRISEQTAVRWNREAERVESSSVLTYDALVIEESATGSPPEREAAMLLSERAWDAGLERFVRPEELDSFLARVAFASQHSSIPPVDATALRDALLRLCAGLRSFAELKDAAIGFRRTLEEGMPPGAAAAINRLAPERIPLPNGRNVRVHYVKGQTPWIASRLQDFFGMRQTPRIAAGNVPLLVHLLAPNNRPVQVTQDLDGFWQRLYPQVRRELSRRYPKHQWPEKP